MIPAFDPKRPTETDDFSANFVRRLGTGETISGGTCKIVLADDTSETDIPVMKSGAISISGTEVIQKITGGTDGVHYRLIFTATTSFGNVKDEVVSMLVQRDQT